jgi:hypothetical protein
MTSSSLVLLTLPLAAYQFDAGPESGQAQKQQDR